MLVASNRPPIPVSKMIQSTCWSSNQLMANIMVSSKKLLPRSSKAFTCWVTHWATYSSEIISEPIFARSLNSKRCGEENTPTRKPISFIPEARRCVEEPLPLVPAMCMVGIESPGHSRCSHNSCGPSKPIL